ncbi:hypothetical protein [Algivirga pacifica]|uniref:Uncharacterized protein n=1 Tax=Algivirga pacifica TaxID=1162670 RepID=A0ABP9D4W7_9BACT
MSEKDQALIEVPAIRRRLKLQKKELVAETKEYKNALSIQMKSTVREAKSTGKNAIIISTALIGAYGLLYLLLSNGKKKSKKDKEEITAAYQALPDGPEYPPRYYPETRQREESTIIRTIKANIANFLIGIAKQELAKAIEELKERFYENR